MSDTLTVATEPRRELAEAREICPTTAWKAVSAGAIMVDVREPHEIERAAFAVPGRIDIPLGELERRWSELPRDRDLVLVCAVGQRSLKATYYLMYHGYTRVANLAGGIVAWARKGFPVSGEVPAASSTGGCCGAPAATSTSANCGSAQTAGSGCATSGEPGGCC